MFNFELIDVVEIRRHCVMRRCCRRQKGNEKEFWDGVFCVQEPGEGGDIVKYLPTKQNI